jgi:hypothetical protein
VAWWVLVASLAMTPVGRAAARPSQAAATIEAVPAAGLVDGQVVDVTVRGVEGPITVAQCDDGLVPPDPVGGRIGNLVFCRWWGGTAVDGVLRLPVTVAESYTHFYRGEEYTTHCGGVGPDCHLVAIDRDFTVVAATTIHFGPPRSEPGLAVTPSSGVRPGELMEIVVTGLGIESNLRVSLCEQATVAELEEDQLLLYSACQELGTSHGFRDPLVVEAPLVDTWPSRIPTGPGVYRCGSRPGGCVVVVTTNDAGRDGILLAHDIDVDPAPLTIAPGDQEAGVAVEVFAHLPDRAGQAVAVAQCAAPVPATASGRQCAPGVPITLDDVGDAAVDLTVVESIPDAGGMILCTHRPCAVAVIAADRTTLAISPLTVHAPDAALTLDVVPTGPYHEGQEVELRFTGTRNSRLRWAHCAATVIDDRRLDETRCSPVNGHWLDSATPTFTTGLNATRRITTAGGTEIACTEPGACVFAADSGAGDFVWAPATMTDPPTATLTPSTGLLEGQNMTLRATGLRPDWSYPVWRCDGPRPIPDRCEQVPGIDATPAADGTAEVLVPARAIFRTGAGADVYCHRQCHVGLEGELSTFLPYALAGGTLTADPATDLTDGQAVAVTASQLVPTYPGEWTPFMHQGEWALTQCDRRVTDAPSIAALYRWCGLPPGTGIVEVPGTDLHATVEVQAHLATLTGHTTDCTTSPCALALTRHEIDGTLTLLTTPLAFA